MGGHHADLPADAVSVEHLAACTHDGEVRLSADNDADAQLRAHERAPTITGLPMSVRACMPSKCTRARLAYARARADSMSAAAAATQSTRPPLVRSVPSPSRRVPAWKQRTSPSSESAPLMTSPRRTSPG